MSHTPEQNCWALIPATGVGQRMGADRPKQYLQLGDKTILEHTLDTLFDYPAICGIVLVLHPEDAFWQNLDYQANKPLLIADGGSERHHSVRNGLQCLQLHVSNDPVVLVHDAVRPLVLHQDLDALIEVLGDSEDGALLACPVSDTLKRADEFSNCETTVSREKLWRAFTPQAFRLSLLLEALNRVIGEDISVTDDASAIEFLGRRPRLVESSPENIKITRPEDLALAKALLSARSLSTHA